MKNFLLFVFIGCFFFTNAQLIVEEIEYVTKKEKNTYHFPNVICKTNPAVADSINFTIRNDFFYTEDSLLPPLDTLFASVSDLDNRPLYYDINYTVTTNNSHLLSISVGADGCGAYCEYFTNYYNFDVANGHWLSIEELITTDGLKYLSDSMTAIKSLYVKHQIESLQAKLATLDSTKKEEEEEMGYYTWGISEYTDCQGHVTAGSSFLIKHGEIEFISGTCLPHAIRALDEIGEFHFPFKISALGKYLTPYGKKLLAK